MKLPKRRKSKDNPYTLKYDEKSKSYTISFVDSTGKLICMPIDYSLYEVFNKFELEDISELNEFDRHIEHMNIMENDEVLYKRVMNKVLSVEEIVHKNITNYNLNQALNKLSFSQKRRIKMYFFEEKTYEEIARIEGCSIHSVYVSIERGKNKIKKILNLGVKN